mmetsp:Transcript_4447/g.10765  ORF Transcript_4447/g.10765 Transcript_4447/m.10765 type:complete len:291 (-) Transcript_4447:563-1435(-)
MLPSASAAAANRESATGGGPRRASRSCCFPRSSSASCSKRLLTTGGGPRFLSLSFRLLFALFESRFTSGADSNIAALELTTSGSRTLDDLLSSFSLLSSLSLLVLFLSDFEPSFSFDDLFFTPSTVSQPSSSALVGTVSVAGASSAFGKLSSCVTSFASTSFFVTSSFASTSTSFFVTFSSTTATSFFSTSFGGSGWGAVLVFSCNLGLIPPPLAPAVCDDEKPRLSPPTAPRSDPPLRKESKPLPPRSELLSNPPLLSDLRSNLSKPLFPPFRLSLEPPLRSYPPRLLS